MTLLLLGEILFIAAIHCLAAGWRSFSFLQTALCFSSCWTINELYLSTGSTEAKTEPFLLTVSSNQGFDALASPLAEPVHHEEQKREDEEGRDATDDESHPAGHGVKKTVSIWQIKQEIRIQPATFTITNLLVFLAWVQASKLAAFFWIFPEVLTTLRTLAQRCHAHLWLAVMTRAAQTRVVPLWCEVVALVHHVVLYVDASLPCRKETWHQQRVEDW